MNKLAITTIVLCSTGAFAQDDVSEKTGLYVGLGSAGTAIIIDGTDDDPVVSSLSFKAGYKFNDNLAIEGRIFGQSDEESVGYNQSIRLDSGQALYLRVSVGNPTFDPYILVGFASNEATLSVGENYYYYGYEVTGKESGGAIGFGANWNINETVSITGDWTRPAEDVVRFNLGLDFKF